MKRIIRFIKKLLRQSKRRKHIIDPKYILDRVSHPVSKADISSNALKVISRLTHAGFQAYIVGGSVRDLLLGKSPKDFDIATDATPQQIRGLFRNARIIGRRFKIAHILYHREIIEVTTFRGHAPISNNQQANEHGMLIRDNVYGSLEEDAWRRDFTINALYYRVADESIIDFTQGVNDIAAKRIQMIGDPSTRYQEDPVRMLRAIRFAAKLQFELTEPTRTPIITLAASILHISGSRLFDEILKLYHSGHAIKVQELLVQYGLFNHLFPQTAPLYKPNSKPQALFQLTLESTDQRILDQKPVTPAFLYAALLWFPLQNIITQLQAEGVDLLPALEQAISKVIQRQNKIVTIPKRYTQVIREIWLLQYRLTKRTGLRAYQLLQHPRFRAAYDFLALRALVKDADMGLAEWWTLFQDADDATKEQMVARLKSKKKI